MLAMVDAVAARWDKHTAQASERGAKRSARREAAPLGMLTSCSCALSWPCFMHDLLKSIGNYCLCDLIFVAV